MKILDLGSHDGYIANWLGRTLRDQGLDVQIDGVELNPDAVRMARDRALRDKLPGTFKIGLAEDAFKLFEAGDYDAVVAFELIEHVPDVPNFLAVCEMMLNETGRIYLSTPDGTFGEGQNPHHLRVYRSIDLFDLCRRRGIVDDMLIGRDGVSVISYHPDTSVGSRGEAVIYCGPGWEKWSPRDIDDKGLGGSETAAVHVAHELTKLGYTVTVYAEVEQMIHRQVSFRHHSAYDPLEPTDLTIVSRIPQLFDRPIAARRKVLWMHDTDYGPELTQERASAMDAIFVLSEWHQQHVHRMYPFIRGDKLIITRNGIDPERFPLDQIPARNDRPQRAIYSSSPDRGLDLILDIWPDVRERCPDAELVYCYSSVYDRIAEQDPTVGAFREKVRKLADQYGVTNLGSLDQWALAGAMSKCRAWLAPSFHSPSHHPFCETFCIGAVEAAAAGCDLIMSDWGALAERTLLDVGWELIAPPLTTATAPMSYVQDAYRAPSEPGERWPEEAIDKQAWVDAIVHAMEDKSRDEGPSQRARALTWKDVACDLAGVPIGVEIDWATSDSRLVRG